MVVGFRSGENHEEGPHPPSNQHASKPRQEPKSLRIQVRTFSGGTWTLLAPTVRVSNTSPYLRFGTTGPLGNAKTIKERPKHHIFLKKFPKPSRQAVSTMSARSPSASSSTKTDPTVIPGSPWFLSGLPWDPLGLDFHDHSPPSPPRPPLSVPTAVATRSGGSRQLVGAELEVLHAQIAAPERQGVRAQGVADVTCAAQM